MPKSLDPRWKYFDRPIRTDVPTRTAGKPRHHQWPEGYWGARLVSGQCQEEKKTGFAVTPYCSAFETLFETPRATGHAGTLVQIRIMSVDVPSSTPQFSSGEVSPEFEKIDRKLNSSLVW